MGEAFFQGAVAGFAIAVPVGAIAILIIERGVRRGFPDAFAAGLGTASADLFYAALAATAGAVVAELVRPVITPLRVGAVVVLVAIAVRGLIAARRKPEETDEVGGPSGPLATYVTFLGLTLLNPATVVYFASLIVGLDLTESSAADKAVFVAAAFLASASWQTFLAGMASVARTRLSERFRTVTSVVGSVVILLLALQTASKI